jgi:hypothetical protein
MDQAEIAARRDCPSDRRTVPDPPFLTQGFAGGRARPIEPEGVTGIFAQRLIKVYIDDRYYM